MLAAKSALCGIHLKVESQLSYKVKYSLISNTPHYNIYQFNLRFVELSFIFSKLIGISHTSFSSRELALVAIGSIQLGSQIKKNYRPMLTIAKT